MSQTGLLGCAFLASALAYSLYKADQKTDLFVQDRDFAEVIKIEVEPEYAPRTYSYQRTKFKKLRDEVEEMPFAEEFRRQGQCGIRQFVSDYFNQLAHIALYIAYDSLADSEENDFVTRYRHAQKSDRHYQLYTLYHSRLDQELCGLGNSEEAIAMLVAE